MDPKDILAVAEAMDKSVAAVGTKLGAQIAELNETARKVLEPKPEDIVTGAEQKAEKKADMEEAGALAGITSLKVWDIPLGQAAVGGFVAVVASELIDGFLANQGATTRGLVKLVGAGATIKWGRGLLGNTGAAAVALLLAYDGLRSLLPIDEWASRVAGGVTPLTGFGLGGKAGMGDSVNQAEKVASNYYSGITSRVG